MGSSPAFVPPGFEPPPGLVSEAFVLEPLGPHHNEADYAAWTSSMTYIHGLPGFEGQAWPHEMSLEANREDLEGHARDFEQRSGFTYTVLDPVDGDVIGCVYVYPARDGSGHDASVRSWVRADRAPLDGLLWQAVSDWLRRDWPFANVVYASRR
jgi:hypothetical protein